MDIEKRLCVDIPEELYKKIKMVTSARGCSIRAYIMGHIQHIIERDMRHIFEKESYDATFDSEHS